MKQPKPWSKRGLLERFRKSDDIVRDFFINGVDDHSWRRVDRIRLASVQPALQPYLHTSRTMRIWEIT